jgi:hypothetical protein
MRRMPGVSAAPEFADYPGIINLLLEKDADPGVRVGSKTAMEYHPELAKNFEVRLLVSIVLCFLTTIHQGSPSFVSW